MNVNLRIQRIYNLGNYQSIHVGVELEGLPDTFITDKAKRDSAISIMLLSAERSYLKYVELRKSMIEKPVDEIAAWLEEQYEDSVNRFLRVTVEEKED